MLLRCLVALAIVTNAAGQDPAFSTDVNVVMVYATVRDPKGSTIKNLAKDDFTVQEDGKPQTIRYFSREFDTPLTIGLLVDTCPWQLNVLQPEKTASSAFLADVLGDSDKAFVLHFDKIVEVAQEFTSSRDKLGAAIAGLQALPARPGGGCHFFQAIQQASEMMMPQTGRKAFILLSGGIERGSKISLGTAIEFAQRSDAMIYSIPFQTPLSPRYFPASRAVESMYKKRGIEVLQRLARETGGGYFPTTEDRPIEKIYVQIEEELRSQYVIGYVPDQANPGRAYRKLHVAVKNRDALVRAREGYYPK